MSRPTDALPAVSSHPDEIRLVDLATIVLRRRKVVAAVTAGCVLLVALVLLLQPTRYRAQTVLVPAMEKGGGARVGALISQLPGGLQSLAGGATADPKQKLIESILKSSSLEDALVARVAAPAGPTEAELRRILRKRTRVEGSLADGSITVQVTAADPELAARIANEFPPLVNEIATRLGADLAEHKQTLLLTQLDAASDQLAASEQRLLGFQEQRDLPEAEEQARLTIEVAARLREAIIAKEMEVAQLRRTATSDNPALRSAVAELSSLRQQFADLSAGRGPGGDILIPLRSSPELRLAATRLLRDYTKDEQIYIALTAALADTQIDAQNSLPVVGVLDAAAVPTTPAPDYAGLILGIAALLGLLLGLVAAFLGEYLARLRADPENAELFAAWREFTSGVRFAPRRGHRGTRTLPAD